MITRLPVVGVMGSGTRPHLDRSVPLGAWLATLPVHLLTGGGGGVMEAVSRAFCAVPGRRGLVIGVLPGGGERGGAPGTLPYPNPWVEIPVPTHLPLTGSDGAEPMSRNHINVLTSRLVIALPGSFGTATEVRLALRYRRPLVAFLADRADIPGLPPEVQVESDLDGVQAFVLQHLDLPA